MNEPYAERETAANAITVPVRQLDHGTGLPLPVYESDLAAGLDLRAAVDEDKPATLQPGARMTIPTGLAIALPGGFEAQIRPRSGLAAKQGLTVLNSPGTVDADYRGEVKVLLINLGEAPITIERGMRIAQLVVAPISRIEWRQSDALPQSSRGSGGFGSTGAQ